MFVKVVGFTKDNYHKTLATLTEQQTYMTYGDVREPGVSELTAETVCGKIAVVIDPKDFPEMDRFVVVVG